MQLSADKAPLNVDQEVDLLEYLHAILRAKYRILILSVLVAGAVFGYSKTVDSKYRSTAVMAVNISQGVAGTRPGQYRGSDVVGILEYSLMVDEPYENEQSRLLARLTSNGFIELFIEENDLFKYIFREQWNEANQSWIEGFVPSMQIAVMVFRGEILSAEVDGQSGLLPISMTTVDPQLSARLANAYFERFNRYTRDRRLAELAQQRDILNQRLDATSNIEMQRSIYRMLETQLAEEIILNAKSDYPLEPIQTAQPALFKSAPNRKMWTIVAFMATAMLSVLFVIGRIVFKKLTAALGDYGQPKLEPALTGNSEVAEDSPQDQLADHKLMSAKKEFTKREVSLPIDELDEWLD